MIEGSFLAHDRQHAAHSWRQLRVLDVQFDISWELTGMATWAKIIGPRYFHLSHSREDRLGTQLPVMSLLAPTTSDGPRVGRRDCEFQDWGQSGGSSPPHGRTRHHIGNFPVQACRLSPTRPNTSPY